MNIQRIRYNFLKKCFQKLKILISLAMIGAILASCSTGTVPKNTGVRADEELLEQIRQEMENKKQPILADEGDVFWTPTGSIWHLSSECGSLKRSETILHGTVDEARTAGMEKECSRCKVSEIIASLDDELQDGDVFFTLSGTLLHTYDKCSYIANSDSVLHGTPEEAAALGKTKRCARCAGGSGQPNIDGKIELGDVFWTEGGTRWHISLMCVHILNAEIVYHGSVEEAQNAGKTGLCTSCGKR